jgi:hypothetical protein
MSMVVVVRERAVGIALVAWIVLSVSLAADSAGLSADKPIKLVGPEIEAVLDIPKKQVRINRFSVEKDIPTGKLQHQLPKPYIVRLTLIPKIRTDGITTFKASDWYDGIGLKLEIKLFISKSGNANGTVNITSQHEETTLFYSAQQLEVRQE